jgi:hypothetical protein
MLINDIFKNYLKLKKEKIESRKFKGVNAIRLVVKASFLEAF